MKKLFIVLLLSGGNVFAQTSEAIPGRALVLIRSENADQVAEAFRPIIESPDFKDPQKLALTDEAKVRELFILPNEVSVTMLRPFIPQHSVANQKLRQHLNPILWMNWGNSGSDFQSEQNHGLKVRATETDAIADLREAEGRMSRWFELRYSGDVSPEAVVATIKKSAVVEEAEPRYRRQILFTPNDPRFPEQYAPFLMRAPEAWDIVRADSTLVIADIDNGTDWTHPDLQDAIWINYGETGIDSDGYDKRANGLDDDGDGFVDDWHGWDFGGSNGTSPDNNPIGSSAHGTHTAGIMAASGNNKTGICGIAFGTKLIPIKASDDRGGSIDYGYDGIVYAADHGAVVANNSWGGTTRSSSEQDIVNYATAKNCAIVAASGNTGQYLDFYPASYKNVMSVGANDPGGPVATYSNYGTHVDVSAPGTTVLSIVPGAGYSQMSGTSMASPNAAGALALVRMKYPLLEPAQAIERLRTTATFVDVAAPRTDLTGHGRVNMPRSLTDSLFYSARFEKLDINDDNGDHILTSGESGDLVVNVRNYLAPVKNLQAKVELLTAKEYVTLNTTTLDFGAANTLDLIQNLDAHFRAQVAEIAPPNTNVLVKLTFSDEKVGYPADVDYFSFIVNPAYQDLNTNNLIVTFDSKADIGYNDPPSNTQGNGFEWAKAPEMISAKGRSVLWQAGLMIGIDAEHVASAAPNEFGGSSQDFAIVKPITYILSPDHANAAQELATTYNDSNATTNFYGVGTNITQRSYAFTKGLSANAVVIDYSLMKRPITDSVKSLATDSTSIGLFMDWDIGFSGANNSAYLASDRVTAIMKRNDPGYPFVGIRLISDIPSGSALQYYAIENDGSRGSVSTYNGFDRSEKWTSLSQDRAAGGPGDVSEVYGLRNVPLRTLDSVRLTYVIALGTDEASLLQSIEDTRQEWFKTTSVKPIGDVAAGFSLRPNPMKDVLHLRWENAQNELTTIVITDLLGRVMYRTTTREHEFDIKDVNLTSGEYFVEVKNAEIALRKMLVKQ